MQLRFLKKNKFGLNSGGPAATLTKFGSHVGGLLLGQHLPLSSKWPIAIIGISANVIVTVINQASKAHTHTRSHFEQLCVVRQK